MKKTLPLLLAICFAGLAAKTQTVSVRLLKSSVIKILKIKSLSYNVRSVTINPFSVGDTIIVSKCKETFVSSGFGKIITQNKFTNINNYQTQLREVYRNDTLYTINLKDSLYSVDLKPKNLSNYLYNFVEQANYAIRKHPSKILLRGDTTINDISCYSFFINTYDTVENSNHNFTHQFFYLNKQTLMPVLTTETGAGNAEKGGYSLGRLSFYNVTNFSNYQLDREQANGEFRFSKMGFKLRYEKMLAEGAVAPDILVKDLTNKPLSTSYFKHKIMLLEFGSTTCGANPLANPMLNRLSREFNSDEVLIVSVYSEENAEQVKKYIKANSLQFPVYLGDETLKKRFQAVGTPNFYIVDRNGIIIKSFNGYDDQLESRITKELDRLKRQNSKKLYSEVKLLPPTDRQENKKLYPVIKLTPPVASQESKELYPEVKLSPPPHKN